MGYEWFSSDTVECATYQPFFDVLDKEFCFTLDVAASTKNAKCPIFYTKEEDGLIQPWNGVVWCNPPYGRGIDKWILKAKTVAENGDATVVMLLPSRTDTQWWHNYVMNAEEVRFVKGRIPYNKGQGTRFANVVVIFRNTLSGGCKFSTMSVK